MGDPLASGVIDSLQRPGRNIIGISSLSVPLAAKRLELLKNVMLVQIRGPNVLDAVSLC